MSNGNSTRTRAKDALQAMGYPAEVDSDGDLAFRSENLRVFLRTDPNDPTFMSVFVPCEGNGKVETLETANRIARKWKCTKMMVYEEGVFVADELLVPVEGDIAPILRRAVNVVTAATKSYLSQEA